MTISNISSEATWSVGTKFYVEPSEVVGTKSCSNCPVYTTDMVTMPVVKTLKTILLWTNDQMTLKLEIWDRVLEKYQDCLNTDLGFTFIFLQQGQTWQDTRTKNHGKVRRFFPKNVQIIILDRS